MTGTQSLSEANKLVIAALFEHVMSGKVDEALALVDADYVEHNPTIGSGREGLEGYFRNLAAAEPAPRVEVQRIIADDEHVVVQMRTLWSGARPDTDAIDIFKLRDGLIVEHWDAVQEAPSGS